MKKIFLILFFLTISLFARDLTVKKIITNDITQIQSCVSYPELGYCDEKLSSYQKFGIEKTIAELTKSNEWKDVVKCFNVKENCDKVILSKKDTLVNELNEKIKEMSMFGTIFTIVFVLVLLAWLTSFFTIVNEKTAKVIEVFGKFSSVKQPGFNFKPPFPLGFVAGIVNLQIQELEAVVGTKSKDNAFLDIPVRVQFKVIDEKVKAAFYELEDPYGQMKSYIINSVRSKATKMTMDQLFESKDVFEEDVKNGLNEKFKPFGYEIQNVLVDDPQPSAKMRAAFDRVLEAEKLKEAAYNEADALKIKEIGKALAEKESLILKGDAFTEYRARIAKGNIEAMGIMIGTHEMVTSTKTIQVKDEETGEMVSKEVETVEFKEKETPINTGLTQKDILKFFEGVDYREAIRDVGKNGNTILLPATNSNESNEISKIMSLIEAIQNNKDSDNKDS